MTALYSGIGSLINMSTSLLIAIRLFKPAMEEARLSITSFRGALFWMFTNLAIFQFFMAYVIISDDLRQVGIWGYALGHVFLYLSLAVYIFAPFKIIAPNRKLIPAIIASITVVAGAVVSYINFDVYINTNDVSQLPEYVNDVVVWNPPEIVFIFIAGGTLTLWILFGTVIFWYHARQTKNPFLRRRSFLIGLGLLVTAIGGPLHDGPLEGASILIADVITSLGFVIIAFGVLLRAKTTQ